MFSSRRTVLALLATTFLVAVVGCGGASDVSEVSSQAAEASETVADAAAEADDDHGDDDHGDDDHGDDDHGDDDHGDDDHGDDDHGDDDHGDDDHADDKHDDHADDKHDDHDDHDDHEHDDDISGGFDAHVHGAAELFVVVAGADVMVELISPAYNIFGFEYDPLTDEDKAIVDERTTALTQSDLLAFNSNAACTLIGDVQSEREVAGVHAEITTTWSFVCDNVDQISELEAAALFNEFPTFLDIDAQWVSDAGQSAAELSPSSTALRFE